MHLFIISCKFHSFNQRISGIGVNENAIIFELQIPPAGLPQKSSNSLNNIIPRGALYRVSVHPAGWNKRVAILLIILFRGVLCTG